MMLDLPPLTLYVHFPWCVKKCPYCDFNSHELKAKMPDEDYFKSLLNDLKLHQDDLQGRQFQAIFLGGGTPSLFPTKTLGQFFKILFQNNLVMDQAEITLEVNPGTTEHGCFDDYKQMGINRISLGAQSFQDDKLRALGRIHSKNQIYQAVDKLKHSGFDNFNIDLMHGLPNQTEQDALFDLSEAIALEPSHLSWYQLTLEPNTQFAYNPPKLPNEEVLEAIEINGKKLLKDANFDQYEVSAYARENKRSMHNLNYWQFGDYIGIGAGAHSKVTYPETNKIKRTWKIKHPKLYLASNHYQAGNEIVDESQLSYEFMLNALRLMDGFSYEMFEKRTGLHRGAIKPQIEKGIDLGLIEQSFNSVKPTDKGALFLNDLIHLFL